MNSIFRISPRTSKWAFAAAALATGAVLVSCSSTAPDDGAASPAGELTPLTVVTNWLPSATYAPLYTALETGIFAEHGLDVTIESASGSLDAAAKVGAGVADIGLIDSTAALVAINQGVEITNIIAYVRDYPGGVCYNADRVQFDSIEDITGVVLGTIENDAFTLGLKALMTDNGLDPAEHITEEIVDVASQQSALLAGRVDMIPCAASSKVAAIANGEAAGVDIAFFDLAEHGLEALGFGVVVSNEFLKSDEAAVQAFVSAFIEATELAIESPDVAVDAVKAAVPDTNVDFELQVLVEEIIPRIGEDGSRFLFTERSIEATAKNVLDSYGTEIADPEQYFDNTFVGAP